MSKAPGDAVRRMNELREIGDEITAGMTEVECLETAEKLEVVAKLIRQQVCAACGPCKKPFCRRLRQPHLFFQN